MIAHQLSGRRKQQERDGSQHHATQAQTGVSGNGEPSAALPTAVSALALRVGHRSQVISSPVPGVRRGRPESVFGVA
jgi:hypothetical protein